jgi:hypothetical protein
MEFGEDPRRPPRYSPRENRAPGPHDSTRLGESTRNGQPLGQLVQRPEQQDLFHRTVGQVEITRVGHRRPHPGQVPRLLRKLLHVPRNQIPVLYLIATLREPQGVAPGTAADVSDNCRRRREATEHNLRSPQKLEATATLG